MAKKETINLAPQEGFQTKFFQSRADVVIGGGCSGAGKTWILEFVAALPIFQRIKGLQTYNGLYSATIFRRTYPEIENPGGLWDESFTIYPYIGGSSTKSSMEWKFIDPKMRNKEYAKIVFRHMQREEDKLLYQGSQLPFIGFDELTHFEKSQFLYLFSRNRSTIGFRPVIRATCNPDADSFVAEMIEWYLDDEGFIHPDRDGKVRYFTVDKDKWIWGDSKQEVAWKAPYLFKEFKPEQRANLIKSFQFIEGDIQHNKILLDKDPQYLANLMSLSEEDQLRLLKKNWKIKIEKNIIFDHRKFIDIFSNDWVKDGQKFITSDIATTGRDLFLIYAWSGKRLIDMDICRSNSGKEAIERIDAMRKKHHVPNSNILFDADGVGSGLTGWMDNCVEFHANKKAFGSDDYGNLKSQLFFELANCINQTGGKKPDDMYFIEPHVAEMKYPHHEPERYRDRTIRWIFEFQMKAIRQDSIDKDRKLRIIRKDEQKNLIGGLSPDFMDCLMMREYFERISTQRFVSI